MQTVADLIDEVAVKQLATPSNFRLGQEIADNGGVTFTEFTPLKVAAHVAGPTTGPRNTVLEAAPVGLQWNCTCNSKGQFCKHVVATALETWRKSPARHT
ncbi:MAG TPA: SWIM zinc finger family protein [Nevskiaceae bacterium]|nr:SWIM zinc finger family protein [Nevskiaceae bacterium]